MSNNTEYNRGGLGGALSYIGRKLGGGLVGFTEGIVDFTVGGLAKVFGNNELSDYMIKNQWMDYEAADREFNPDAGAKFIGDAMSGVGNSAIPFAATLLTGGMTGVGGALAKYGLQFGVSFLSAGGNAVTEAYQESGDINDQTWLYGAGSGALEGTLETADDLLLIGLGAFSKGFEYAAKKGAMKMLWQSARSEAYEEGISTVLAPYLKRATYNPNAQNATKQERGYSTVVGALSGFLMGGGGQVINAANDIRIGSVTYNNGNSRDSVLSAAKELIDYDEKEQTGSEAIANIKQAYDKIIAGTNAISEMRQLGVLKQQIGAALLEGNAATAAMSVLADPQATVDSINAFYGGNRITVEELTKGLKSTDVNSKEFGKSLFKALRENDTLRNIVAIQMVGNAELATRDYAEAILGDTPISTVATQQNLNRFVETSDPETIRRVSEALGINMYTATASDLADAIARARDGRTLTAYEAGLRAVREAQGARASLGDAPLNITSLIKLGEGASRFTIGNRDVAIIREGSLYRLYDYKSGEITKPLTAAEAIRELQALRDGSQVGENTQSEPDGEKTDSEKASAAKVKEFCEEKIPEYKKLTPSEREAVRMTVRQAMALGASEADTVLFGRFAAISGMNIYIRENIPGENAFYNAREQSNGIYINLNAQRSKTFGQLLGHEMFHRMFALEKGGMKLYKSALKLVPKDLKQRITKRYDEVLRELAFDEASRRAITTEEAAAAYSETIIGTDGVMDYLLSEKPSLKDRIIDFFTGASKKYSFEDGLSSAAKRWLKEYKKLFDKISEKNKSSAALVNATKRYGDETTDDSNEAKSGKRSSLMDDSGSSSVEFNQYVEYDKPITVDDVKKIHDISAEKGKLSINSFTSEEIKATQKWASKFDKELGAKSPFFRAWLGEWRAHQDREFVEVVDIPRYFATNEDRKKNRGVVKNDDTGWNIRISREGETNTISHAGDERLSEYGLSGIKELIKHGIFFDSELHEHHNNNAKNDVISFDHKIYSLGRGVNGKIALYKITVEEFFQSKTEPGNKRFHNLRYVTKIADDVGGRTSEKTRSGGSTNDSSAIYSISDLYEFVKTYDKDFTPAPEVSEYVLNDDGTPRVFYHGTNADFNIFDLEKSGANFGKVSEGLFFFTSKKDSYPGSANDYAKHVTETKGGKERIYECYIRMKNPLVIDSQRSYDPISHFDKNADRIYEKYFNGDYDGIIVKDSTGKNSDSILALVDNATQIKSATDNIGTFDRTNPDIRFSLMEETDESVTDNAREKETVSVAAEEISSDDVIIERKSKKKPDGAMLKEKAELKNKIVYNRSEVADAVKRMEGVNLLTAKQRGEIIEGLWCDLNAPDRIKAKDGYLEAVARRTTNSIIDGLDGGETSLQDSIERIATSAIKEVVTLYEDGGHPSEKTRSDEASMKRLAADRERLKAKATKVLETESARLKAEGARLRADYARATEALEGESARLKAEYSGEKVFSKSECLKAIKALPIADKLSTKDINEIADKLWKNLNKVVKKKDQAAHLKQMAKIITTRIESLTEISDESTLVKLGVQVEDAVNRMWDLGGQASKKTKLEEKAKAKIETLESKVKSANERADTKDARYQALLELDRTVLMLREKKFGTQFDNATVYKGRTLKDLFGEISTFDFRRTFSETKFREKVKKLSEWYNKDNPMLEYTEDDVGWYNEGIKEYLDTMSSAEGEATVYELRSFNEVLKYFIHLAENYDKVWVNKKWVDAIPLAEKYIGQIESTGKESKTSWLFRNSYDEAFGTPESVMQAADGHRDGFYTQSYKELNDAVIDSEIIIMQIMKNPGQFVDAKENRAWAKALTDKTQEIRGVKLSKIELIEYFMTLHREQAQETLAINGFEVQTDKNNYMRVNGFSKSKNLTKEELRALTMEEIARVEKMLDERDKQFVKLLEDSYKVCGQMKSEADLKRLGISNVVGGYYYPIRRRYVKSVNVWDQEAGCVDRFTYASYNKHTKEHPLQPLEIGSAWDTFNRHVKGIVYYANVSPVTETFQKLWKLNTSGNNNLPQSIESASAHSTNIWRDKSGTNVGYKYYSDLVYNVRNGSKAKDNVLGNAVGWFTGSMSVAALGANPKVWLTQFTSLASATSKLKKRAVIKGLFVSSRDVYKYCPLAELRATDNAVVKAQSVVDKIGKFGEFFTKPISFFDSLVVKKIFSAAQVEVELSGGPKIGTEENKIKAGELARKVIVETQQNNFVTTKTAAARNGGELAKTFMRFKSDAVAGRGKLVVAFGRVAAISKQLKNNNITAEEREALKADLKKAKQDKRKAISAILLNATMMIIITELFKWLYNKDEPEDSVWWLTRIGDYIGNLLGGLPLISDIYEAFLSGYGVESMEIEAVNDFIQTVTNIFETGNKVVSGEATSDDAGLLLKNMTFSLGQLTGIPARNLYNGVYGIIKRVNEPLAYKIDDFSKGKNYKTDFDKATVKGKDVLARDILNTAFEVYVGDTVKKGTADELIRLSGLSYKVAPGEISSSITIKGESVKLTAEESALVMKYYKDAADALDELIVSSKYRGMDDKERAKAIEKLYSTYRSKGYEAVRQARDEDAETPADRLKKALKNLNKKSEGGLSKKLSGGLGTNLSKGLS